MARKTVQVVQEVLAPPAISPLALKADEAARALSIGPNTLYALINEGRIRVVRTGATGRNYVIPVTEIQAFLDRELKAAS